MRGRIIAMMKPAAARRITTSPIHQDEIMTTQRDKQQAAPTVGRGAVYVRPDAEVHVRYISNAEMFALAPEDRPTENLSRSDNGDGYFQVIGVKIPVVS